VLTPDAVPVPGTPEFRTWMAALPKPPGWERVLPDDDCDCPYPGQHQEGCLYS
jgi:hypothetical protein